MASRTPINVFMDMHIEMFREFVSAIRELIESSHKKK